MSSSALSEFSVYYHIIFAYIEAQRHTNDMIYDINSAVRLSSFHFPLNCKSKRRAVRSIQW